MVLMDAGRVMEKSIRRMMVAAAIMLMTTVVQRG